MGATLKSGVHATLSGVLLAMFIPIRSKNNPQHSPLKDLEHNLHTIVAFFVLTVFTFANAGINLTGVTMQQILHGVPIGIALGLFFGKQLGIIIGSILSEIVGYLVLQKSLKPKVS